MGAHLILVIAQGAGRDGIPPTGAVTAAGGFPPGVATGTPGGWSSASRLPDESSHNASQRKGAWCCDARQPG
jgi:hypothetical protein